MKFKRIIRIILKIARKRLKVFKLTHCRSKTVDDPFFFWDNPSGNGYLQHSDVGQLNKTKIFGVDVEIDSINWHLDYVSGFEFPVQRIDNLKINRFYDQGIDIKFPWEVSRFQFAVTLAQKHFIDTNCGDLNNRKETPEYRLFKNLVLDWISMNPFCYGINWYSTMEVAIRSANLVVALHYFKNIFIDDQKFKRTVLKSLVEHARYISLFPEIYKNGHTTNHTVADYTGQLFLSFFLNKHPVSTKWQNMAILGLEDCIRYQTYEDGVNFEASIPYHRYVLEMYSFSSLICRLNGIELSEQYYKLLFKMFEYSAAYMDMNGNAPQIGDNDSGRFLILQKFQEHDHSYLLDLGEHIFNYKFISQCEIRNDGFRYWLPIVSKILVNT